MSFEDPVLSGGSRLASLSVVTAPIRASTSSLEKINLALTMTVSLASRRPE